ncbi:MAG TPA: RNA polymerase sigma factor [Ramlibacter sp.]|nr:RNA polymerase sigma factor [Ramlibacter sp.]
MKQERDRALAVASDEELLARTRAGDMAAFEAIIRAHNRLLFRTVRSILHRDAEAEEVVQEAYLKAWRALPTFRGEAKLSTWLVRIAMNEAFSRLRRSSAEIVPLAGLGDEALFQEAAMVQDAADAFSEPETTALRREVRGLVERHIDALPAQYRIVFVLRALEEREVDEVARLLRVPAATVRTRFFRARSLLREALARELDVAIDGAFAFAGERCDRIVQAVLTAIRASSSAPQ